jgi:hypothetical protein
MRHYDYDWDLEPDRIILDTELNIDKLGWKQGDYFKVKNENGKMMLVKVDTVEKFIIDGLEPSERV